MKRGFGWRPLSITLMALGGVVACSGDPGTGSADDAETSDETSKEDSTSGGGSNSSDGKGGDGGKTDSSKPDESSGGATGSGATGSGATGSGATGSGATGSGGDDSGAGGGDDSGSGGGEDAGAGGGDDSGSGGGEDAGAGGGGGAKAKGTGTSPKPTVSALSPCTATFEEDKRTGSHEEDGVMSYIDVYTFDLEGNRVLQQTDENGNGSFDSVRSSTFDDSGNETRLEIDRPADGNIEATYDFTYDSFGNETSMERFNEEGVLNMAEYATFDDEGKRLRFDQDYDGDGDVEHRADYEYNDAGLLSKLTTSSPDDVPEEPPASFNQYSYNEFGDLILIEQIRSDGEPGRKTIYTYDEARLPTSRIEQSSDGGLSHGEWWVYDADGNLIENRVEESSINIGPPLTWTVYVYDDVGNILRRESHSDDSGEPQSLTVYTYDESGYLLSSDWQLKLFNTTEQTISEYTYDEQGRLTVVQTGSSKTTYSYDADGNLILRELEGNDGVIAERDTYDFSCLN